MNRVLLLIFSLFFSFRANAAVRIIALPLVVQETDYTCGAAAAKSVFGYHGDIYSERRLATELGSDPDLGTRAENIAAFAVAQGYTVKRTHSLSVSDLMAAVNGGDPVMVLLQAWAERPVNWIDDWDDGHYAMVVGYDSLRVYFMDSSTEKHYAYIPWGEFEDRWHDESHGKHYPHFGMVFSKASVKKVTAKPSDYCGPTEAGKKLLEVVFDGESGPMTCGVERMF